MKAILFDLDGVLYEGETPIPAAIQAIQWFKGQNIPHLFVTNTSSRPRSALVTKLSAMGLDISIEDLHTPAAFASDWLREHQIRKVALFTLRPTFEDFNGFEIAEGENEQHVGAVVIGDMGEEWNYTKLNRAFKLLKQSPAPELIALGMTRFWKSDQGLELDAAPFVAALEHASDITARVLGKPSPAFFDAALNKIGFSAADTLMVGDDITSDIGGSMKNGLRAVMVQTGKFQPSDLSQSDIKPTDIIPSIADLPAWWERNT